jgi:hypothetical protein
MDMLGIHMEKWRYIGKDFRDPSVIVLASNPSVVIATVKSDEDGEYIVRLHNEYLEILANATKPKA